MKKGLLIAIDGPVASGKGTIAKLLAKKISAIHFNTGAMYRALALKCMSQNINLRDEKSVIQTLKTSSIELRILENNVPRVFLDGNDVEDKILNPKVAMGASEVGLISEVAQILVGLQRDIAKQASEDGHSVVMEGRQIGKDVIPDADLKLFITADFETRAKRRLKQYLQKGISKDLDSVLKETKLRDFQDLTRKTGALPKDPKAFGYVILDNSNLSEEQTLSVIIEILKEKGFYE